MRRTHGTGLALGLGIWALGAALTLLPARPARASAAPEAPTALRPLPVAQFFAHPRVLAAELSPDGKRLAVTSSHGGERVGLIVVELEGTLRGQKVAQFSDADVARVQWTSNERLVFNVTDLERGSGEDLYQAPGLFSIKADGSELRQLVKQRATPVVSRGEREVRPALSVNHMLLHVPTQQDGVTPDEIVVGRFERRAGGRGAITPLWLNTATGQQRPFEARGRPEGIHQWWFDSRGQARAAMSSSEGSQALWWRETGDGSWRRLAEGPALHQRFAVHSVSDDGTLYITRAEGPEGRAVLSTFDFQTMAPKREALISTEGFDFTGGLLHSVSQGRVLGIRLETDAEQTLWLDPAMQRFQQATDARLPGQINRIDCRRCAEPTMVALVRSYSDRNPGRLWLYQAEGERWTPVATVMPDIDPSRMAKVRFERIRARDGRDLPVWLTVPAGAKPGAPLPSVVLVHGGPWMRGGHWRWSDMEQFLASRGYLVIAPDFRGSTGYGQAHYRAGWKQWGQAMQDDVADALLWARQQGLTDERSCIAGASYGGYATLMGLARHGDLYRCGAAWVGVADLELYVKGSGWVSDDISDQGRRHYMPETVGDPVADAAMLKQHSPVLLADKIRAPLLLAYGEEDLRVPLDHGLRLRAALRDQGREPEWISYPGEGHSWRKVATRVDFAERLATFLQRHLQARPAP